MVKGHDIIVVFDGWKSGGQTEESLKTGGITVIYSRLGEKADTVIKRIIKKEKREWIVITSDRDVMAFAWSCGSVPVKSSEFQSIIESTSKTFTGDYDLLDEDNYIDHKKGNPRKPSKKEKALIRILRKL
jgi:predicted RNA-binding protein with PIN domain